MSLDERNATLDQKLVENPIDTQIATLIRADKRRRFHLIALTLMALALAFGWWQNHNLAITAESNHNAIIRSCENSNEARKNNAVLWDFLLAQQPIQPQTAEQTAFRQEFIALKEKTFAQRDCQAEIK